MATIQISSKSIHASVVWLTAILAFFLTSCTTHGTVQHMGIKTSYLNNEKHDKKYCNKEQGESRYTLDERVGRWKQCTTADEIKNFQDKGRHPYKKKTDKEVYQYQIFHNPTGIIDLLNGAYYDAYFTKESQESISAKASLLLIHKRKRQPRELYRKGTIEIGLDNADPSIIYHMMFRPDGNRPSLKIPYIIVMDEHGAKLEKTSLHDQTWDKVDKNEDERENIAPKWEYRKKANPNKKFFYKKDNVYVIQYIPTKKSCYKFVRLSIHTKREASSCYSAS